MKRLALALLSVACSGAPPTPDAGSPDGGADAGPDVEPEFVRAHNAVRARAMPAPMPALPKLTWSDAAAQFAQTWADGCNFDHNPSLGMTYGENIYATSLSGATPTQVTETWASEEPSYDYANNTCASVCGHYTQIVWRSSTALGCGSKTCTTGSPFGSGPWLFVVCDYTPPGNYVGQRPY